MKTNINVFRCISNEYHNHTEGKRKRQRNKDKGGRERGKDRGKEGKRRKKVKMKEERKEPNNLRTYYLTYILSLWWEWKLQTNLEMFLVGLFFVVVRTKKSETILDIL